MVNNPTNISHQFSILQWNSNGLAHQKNELYAFLLTNHINILLISEAHLTPNSSFHITGYSTYHCDHPDGSAHAGSAILIKSDIKHTLLPPYQNNAIQATNISLLLNHIPTTISSAYFRPGIKLNQDDLSLFFNSLGNHFLVGGDFNAKHPRWGFSLPNTRGRTLNNLIINLNLKIISPTSPTYWPTHNNRHPDVLDFFITTLPNHIKYSITNSLDLSSDHTPILLTLNDIPNIAKYNQTNATTKPNWKQFSQIIENSITLKIPLKTPLDLDIAVQSLTTTIQNAARDASQTNPVTTYPINVLPAHITQLITEKRRARRIWQRTHLPSDRSILNHLTNSLKNILRKHNSDKYQKYLDSLSKTDNSLWKATKKILNEKSKIPPLRNPDNSLATSNIDKANLFAADLKNRFSPNSNLPNRPHHAHVEAALLNTLPMCLPAKHTTPSEVQNIIRNLKNNKAPGHDLITNKIAKRLPKKAIILLTSIFNSILRLSYIPSIWKHSIIILIHKTGKPPDVLSSYRPISLLPTLSKILEKIILKRIYPILNEKKIIPNAQFGFRNKHSSLHQLHRIVDNIASSLEQKRFCSGVFLDIAQAFDRVWHEGLLFKLQFLPTPLYLTIKSFLSNRTFAVRCEDEISISHPIIAGVPQGSILSPTLYNIFTADLPQSNSTTLATFADDTAITSSNSDVTTAINNLQSHLTQLQDWFNLWKIKVNETKSTHITFTLSLKNIPPVHLNNQQIPTNDSVKYLGLVLDKRLTWANHIKEKRTSLNFKLHKLRPLLRSKISLNNKLLIYKQILRPAMTYGIQLWGTSKNSNLNKLQAFQSITLRVLSNAPWYVSNRTLHHDLNLPTISTIASYQYNKLHKNFINHTNPLISNLSSRTLPDNPPRRLKRKWPRDLLTNI